MLCAQKAASICRLSCRFSFYPTSRRPLYPSLPTKLDPISDCRVSFPNVFYTTLLYCKCQALFCFVQKLLAPGHGDLLRSSIRRGSPLGRSSYSMKLDAFPVPSSGIRVSEASRGISSQFLNPPLSKGENVRSRGSQPRQMIWLGKVPSLRT
jgi:hypothetical protein